MDVFSNLIATLFTSSLVIIFIAVFSICIYIYILVLVIKALRKYVYNLH